MTPLPGRFLELALVSADPGAAWQQYQGLGFEPATTGDIWTHAYGVVACHGFAIGVHAVGDEPLSLVFVRQDVAGLHRELQSLGVPVEQARLGSDVFNELTLREPGGVPLRVLEARTFSPPAAVPELTTLGLLDALSLPCHDLDEAAAFWRALGFECLDGAPPFDGLRLQGAPLACHPRRACAEPLLLFHRAEADLDAAVATAGLGRARALPALAGTAHQLLRAADAPALLVIG